MINPTIYGVAFSDMKEFSNKGHEYFLVYKLWTSIIQRCYEKKWKSRYSHYKNTTCSEDWLYFSKFFNDIKELKGFSKRNELNLQLDKDLISKKDIYSKETCSFVPREVNNLLICQRVKNSPYSQGVSYRKRNKKFQARLNINGKEFNLGLFDTDQEASIAYIEAKKKHVLDVINKYKSILDERVYNNMLKYTLSG